MNELHTRNPHHPVYNIKAVSQLVGLLPVTLRAWERRYGLPRPGRGDQGYRLYSEYDVRTLRWLKAQIEAGLSIGRAVEYLTEIRTNGYDPAAEPVYIDRPVSSAPASPSLGTLDEQLLEALIHFDEPGARDVMQRALALHPVDQILTEVIQPTMVTVGDAWHRGELPIAVEHYATQFCMQQLMSLMAAAAPPSHPGGIVAACAPGELHQIGLLTLVVILRWRGWDVKYLGPDLPLDRLEEALWSIQPQILMFSANRVETAANLVELTNIIERIPEPQPFILLGGQAFQAMRLPASVPAIYLTGSPIDIIKNIENLMLHSLRFSPPGQ